MTLKQGYFFDRGYTYGAYPEFSPERLAFVALLHSHRPPELNQPFRCLELGCGQGFSLCLQAATYPQAQFLGLDLKAEHIAHGQALARGGGLDNASFALADFNSLTQQNLPNWGEFDIVTAHGVLGWVSASTGAKLLAVAAAALRPGGLFCVSYNCLPGWLAVLPFQATVKQFQHHLGDGQPALDAALKLFSELQEAGSIYAKVQPNLAIRLETMASQDPAYLLHEYNHSEWQPQYADQVIRQAANLDLEFLGSATLPDGFLGLLPEAFRPLLVQESEPDRRELVRDLLINQSFRRDVYVKGRDPLWNLEANARLRSLELILQSPLPEPEANDAYCFQLGWGEVRGNAAWFDACLRGLSEGPCMIGALEEHLRQCGQPTPTPELLQNIALLLQQGRIALSPPARDPAPAQRFNRHLATLVAGGGPYRSLASPASGNMIAVNEPQMMLLHAALQGAQGEALAAALGQNLAQLQRSLRKDGRPLQDEALRQEIATIAAAFEQVTLPLLRQLQAIA
jgi:SAM-dependent methyltransferase